MLKEEKYKVHEEEKTEKPQVTCNRVVYLSSEQYSQLVRVVYVVSMCVWSFFQRTFCIVVQFGNADCNPPLEPRGCCRLFEIPLTICLHRASITLKSSIPIAAPILLCRAVFHKLPPSYLKCKVHTSLISLLTLLAKEAKVFNHKLISQRLVDRYIMMTLTSHKLFRCCRLQILLKVQHRERCPVYDTE